METGLTMRLRQWFGATEDDSAELPARELALAALLVEMIRADNQTLPAERETVRRVLARRFDLDDAAAAQLLARGERAADRAVSLFEHTRTLDTALGEQEKFAVIEALWETALADGELGGDEDYLAHKLAELLHVRHSDLIRIKEAVRQRLDQNG